MNEPIIFVPSAQDELNLQIVQSLGLSRQAAISAAIASMAAECTPVAWAMASPAA